ncbi:MAG: hypothetical protein ACK41C_09930 [Phenylobacterium sp.]|jgi:hypothetical protein|uniref:hypothetical protein n=1 Tax=Phenylobacterium sp. TaxID=1871053 RepID=UPI00391ABFCC
MRRRTAAGLGISCLLAACAHQGTPPMAGMGWSLHHSEGEGAKLAYGQPNSDNVLVMMVCEPGSGAVRVSMTAAEGANPTLALRAGGRTSALSGETAPAMGLGAVLIEADTRATDPALSAFARTGELTLVQAGRSTVLPTRREERTSVRTFLSECAAA